MTQEAPVIQPPESSRPPAGVAPSFAAERARAIARRRSMDVQRPRTVANAQWALALSGGGIRSATFCLGVLQGLARSPGPGGGREELLHQFDYLSTVSGGGYVGGFFSSLFVPGRLSGIAAESDATAAQRVGEVLREDPPERLHRNTEYEPTRPGQAALAWLRDNGRYMAPSGAGDYLYAAAMAVRNWLAFHYVVGSAVCLLVALLLLGRWGLMSTSPWLGGIEQQLLDDARGDTVWWSSLWRLCIPLALLWPLPAGIAYWFSHTGQHFLPTDKPPAFTGAQVYGLLTGLLFLALGGYDHQLGGGLMAPATVASLGAATASLAAVLWHVASFFRTRNDSLTRQRVLLTRWLSKGLAALLVLALAATIETLAQSAFLNLRNWGQWMGSGSLITAIVWLARSGVVVRNEKALPGWLAALPLDALALVGGLALWVVIAVAWYVLMLALFWNTHEPGFVAGADGWQRACLVRAGILAALFALLVWVVGRFPGFLNLSTLQGLYSARLTRAYLGASNHQRFKRGAPHAARSAAEPIDGDGLKVEHVYANPLAPIHLVNVCVNQTVDPAEQLVQRDRKGKPLVVAPGGFYLDGQPHRFEPAGRADHTEVAMPLGFGDWIGVSGAAFTTGLGRTTSLGMSLLLGFANVRLGRWWPSGANMAPGKLGLLRRCFKTQAYLFDELGARFHGTTRQYQYLSDGGHFENTAVYELLRPRRNVKLIVVCDCGCDPGYGFLDIANLMRLARIDHRLEVTVNESAAADPVLGTVFGRPADLAAPAGADDNRCALLFDVSAAARPDRPARLVARLVVLKPRLIAAAPLDLFDYAQRNPAFPQEPTGDQFYAQDQWESYRKLGLTIALKVFPQDAAAAEAFWNRVLEGLDSRGRMQCRAGN